MPRVSGLTSRCPVLRPVCHFRYFVFFGASITIVFAGYYFVLCSLAPVLSKISPRYIQTFTPMTPYGRYATSREIYVGPKRLQRNSASFNLFHPRHLRSSQSAGDRNSYSLHVAICHHFFNRLL